MNTNISFLLLSFLIITLFFTIFDLKKKNSEKRIKYRTKKHLNSYKTTI